MRQTFSQIIICTKKELLFTGKIKTIVIRISCKHGKKFGKELLNYTERVKINKRINKWKNINSTMF